MKPTYPPALDALLEWLQSNEETEPEDVELLEWLKKMRSSCRPTADRHSSRRTMRTFARGTAVMGPRGIAIRIERIDPETADKYRALVADGQRREVPNRVARYVREMKGGLWASLCPDPIVFDSQGRLVNGQHRLDAVIEAAKGQWFIVIRNYPADELHAIDAPGGDRNTQDVNRIAHGCDMTKDERAVLRAVVSVHGKTDWTPTEEYREWMRHKDAVRWASGLARPRGPYTRAAIVAVFAKASYQFPRERLEDLMAKFLSAQDCPPILISIREWIRNIEKHGRMNSNQNKLIYQKMARALEAVLKGKPITKVQVRYQRRSDDTEMPGKNVLTDYDPFALQTGSQPCLIQELRIGS